MKNKKDIVDLILKRHSNLNRKDITEESLLLDDLELDDLDFIELVMDLEEHFNISIPDEEWYRVVRIKQVISLVNSKIN